GIMAVSLLSVAIATLIGIDKKLGRTPARPHFSDLLSKSSRVNRLSAARLFLFGARDVWFVVALPVFLQVQFGWSNIAVGTLLACWIIGYGFIQMLAPAITGTNSGKQPDGRSAVVWGGVLTLIPVLIIMALAADIDAQTVVVGGLLVFGAVFAINSAVHSYLIVSYAQAEAVTLDVGFYYMSNAAGRLIGTILSGWVYQTWGFEACLLNCAVFVGLAAIISTTLPTRASAMTAEPRQ
ncbi:MAG: MFS transporter, partial [Proteobacteria bacterium]|nr:MFS transporter [Pseudomonadota bacterium]